MSGSPWFHEERWPGDRADICKARDFVTRHLDEHALTGIAFDARLVVSELATNAVLHARTPFTVSLEQRDGSLRVSVHDGSVAEPVVTRPGQLAHGGCGLFLVASLSDTWGVTAEPDGKSVWASFAVSRVSARQPDRSVRST